MDSGAVEKVPLLFIFQSLFFPLFYLYLTISVTSVPSVAKNKLSFSVANFNLSLSFQSGL